MIFTAMPRRFSFLDTTWPMEKFASNTPLTATMPLYRVSGEEPRYARNQADLRRE